MLAEASDLIGQRVCVYNGSANTEGNYLAEVGQGMVARVEEKSGRCVVLMDDNTPPIPVDRKLGFSEWLMNTTHGGVKRVDGAGVALNSSKGSEKCCCSCLCSCQGENNAKRGGGGDDDDDSATNAVERTQQPVLLLVSSQNLAPLKFVGQTIAVVSPEEDMMAAAGVGDDGRLGFCVAFHRDLGQYEVELFDDDVDNNDGDAKTFNDNDESSPADTFNGNTDRKETSIGATRLRKRFLWLYNLRAATEAEKEARLAGIRQRKQGGTPTSSSDNATMLKAVLSKVVDTDGDGKVAAAEIGAVRNKNTHISWMSSPLNVTMIAMID